MGSPSGPSPLPEPDIEKLETLIKDRTKDVQPRSRAVVSEKKHSRPSRARRLLDPDDWKVIALFWGGAVVFSMVGSFIGIVLANHIHF